MKILAIAVLALILSGCETVNLSKTIAGGACGYVDYSVTILGNPMLGIKADRECPEEDQLNDPDK